MVGEDNVLVFETLLVLVPRWLVVVSLSNFRQQSALVKHLEGRHVAVFFFFWSESPLIITHTHLYTHLRSHTPSHLDHQAPTETHTHNPLLVDFHWQLFFFFFLPRWMNLRVRLYLNVFLPLAIFPWTHFHTPFWSIALGKVNEQQQHSETKASVLPFSKEKRVNALNRRWKHFSNKFWRNKYLTRNCLSSAEKWSQLIKHTQTHLIRLTKALWVSQQTGLSEATENSTDRHTWIRGRPRIVTTTTIYYTGPD